MMLTAQDRQDIFYEVLSRLLPEAGKYTPETPSVDVSQARSSCKDVIERLGELPPYSALVGICEDGLPLLFDLVEPNSGSLLVRSENAFSGLHLLQTILSTSASFNPPDKLKFTIITPNPGEFHDFEGLDHCRGVLSAYDRVSSELIVELAEITEQRRYGRNRGEVELLALDDLPAFAQNNDYEVNAYLKWLVRHGPRSMIWPIATVKSAQIWRMENGLLEEFGTIFQEQASKNLLGSTAQANGLPFNNPVEIFTTSIGQEWIRFWVPD